MQFSGGLPRFLEQNHVYRALHKVLYLDLLVEKPKVTCFKTLREFRPHCAANLPVWIHDWLQMALVAVQYALSEIPLTGRLSIASGPLCSGTCSSYS